MPDDGWVDWTRLQGTRSLRARVAGQRISCRIFGSGRSGVFSEGFLTDYKYTYITCTVQYFTGGMVDIGVHASGW